jgi:hypothetical protein
MAKLSWTFYPKHEQPVTLEVIYVPALDQHQLPHGGYLNVAINRAYVDWSTYKRFDDASLEGRKDAFQKLVRLANDGIKLGNEVIWFNQ